MNRIVPIGIGAAAVVVVLVAGSQLLGQPSSSGVGGAPPATTSASPSASPVGGTVTYTLDGAPATTVIDATADGASVSGTAVTTLRSGTHTVRLACAARNGDTWALGGTIEETTVPGEPGGAWSAVIVREGAPQQIGIWLSDTKSEGIDCDGWLGLMDMASHESDTFWPVESGVLVPPPDPAT